MHLGKVTILHISLRSIAEYFAKNSLRSFGKNFCKQFASLIWQKESLYRANFATFASLNICKIILNVRSAHYLQINLCTLAMLAHKLGPSLGFFGCLTLFYFGLLWQVGCRYTYYSVWRLSWISTTSTISFTCKYVHALKMRHARFCPIGPASQCSKRPPTQSTDLMARHARR